MDFKVVIILPILEFFLFPILPLYIYIYISHKIRILFIIIVKGIVIFGWHSIWEHYEKTHYHCMALWHYPYHKSNKKVKWRRAT